MVRRQHVAGERHGRVLPRVGDMRVAGAVIHLRRLQVRKLLPNVGGVEHVDERPSCQPCDLGWRLRSGPPYEIGRAREMLEEVAARKARRPGHEHSAHVRRSYCAL